MADPKQRLLNKKFSQMFRQRGLTVRPAAMQPLYDVLEGDEAWESTLKELLTEIEKKGTKDGNVDAADVNAAIDKRRTRTVAKPTLPLEVIDAFNMQPLRFDTQRRTFVAETTPPSMFGPADAKAAMYRLRLAMVEQRTRRHAMFKPPVLAQSVQPREYIELTSIDALLGRTGQRVCLGLLVELEEGVFHLEDAHAAIPLDLSGASITTGLFTRYCVVLAEGEVQPSGVFKVRQLGLPPPEPRQCSIESFGAVDPLRAKTNSSSPTSIMQPSARGNAVAVGAPAHTSVEVSEAALENSMLVVLSDVFLDQPKVLVQLEKLFKGYEDVGTQTVGIGRAATPLASFFTFVLCGNFASRANAAAISTGSKLRQFFKNLASVLAKTPVLARHAHFVLVPGPDDPCLSSNEVLPRASMPRTICTAVLEAVEHCTLASTPCRLVLCGQHIVVHREELLVKMRRQCVISPMSTGNETLNDHLMKTLIDGAHLSPLPAYEAAVSWQHEHTLWLHPAPDVLVLCDRQNQWQTSYEETLGFNPGEFSTGFSWMTYYPKTRGAEESVLMKD